MTLNERIFDRFKIAPHHVVYEGGVLGQQVTLKREDFSDALLFLIEIYGPPKVFDIWHPSQALKPLRFGLYPWHVNLLLMGRSQKHQRTWLTYWPETGEAVR